MTDQDSERRARSVAVGQDPATRPGCAPRTSSWLRPLRAAASRAGARTLLGVTAVALGLSAVGAATPAHAAETYPVPSTGVFTLDGLGYGHGKGMSQWGAYGAASIGRTYSQILAQYYPGTTLAKGGSSSLRVRLTVDDGILEVVPDLGRKLSVQADGAPEVLPAQVNNCSITRWRTLRYAGGVLLQGYGCGIWNAVPVNGRRENPAGVSFSDSAHWIKVVLGSPEYVRAYRGSVALRMSGSSDYTVNQVPMEDYLRSVTAWEMSAGWLREALKVQAVAARTYASWDAMTPAAVYDTCDSTACQAYRGAADFSTSGALRYAYEFANSDAAVAQTAGQILSYHGYPAFTQFGAANGGRSVADPNPASYPYLRAADDPWDGIIPNTGHSWTAGVSASRLGSYYGVGTVTALQVQSRVGGGTWGGRVGQVAVIGTKGTRTVSGGSFRSTWGLRSDWFKPENAPMAPPTTAPPTMSMPATTAVSDTVIPLTVSGLAGNEQVSVQLMPVGASTYQTVGTATANTAGVAAAQVPLRVNSTLRVVASGRTSKAIQLRALLVASVAGSSAGHGTATVRVTLDPLLAGVAVDIYGVRGNGDKVFAGRRTTAAGSGVATLTASGLRPGDTWQVVAKPIVGPERTGVWSALARIKVG